MTEQQACALCGAEGHTAAQCHWNGPGALESIRLPKHGTTIALEEMLAGYLPDDREDVREVIEAYADIQARKAVMLFSGAGLAGRQSAALAQPSPAAELERPEVVGHRVSLPDEPELGHWLEEEAESEPQIQHHEPLMTVAQHERIDAARVAEIEELDGLVKRLGDLLSQVAIALRGPEPPLTRYGYADLPLRVKTLVDERDATRARLAGGEQDVRKIVTESLLGMISSVASASPPPGAPLPDFIQAPIDRAATRIGQHIARVLAERDTPAANAGQVTDDQLRQAYLAGWLASAQGWNGEHPPMACTTADWLRKAEESVRKIAAAPDLGGDA
ncbi:hypothetical protein [Pseudomonas citronellolis]|uniref:hypothetical protein n=1 Tax=Pseudomonas citronellolis TaxID=53408 RepID=UPI00248EA029|nr:hypothetical protein [Pseudomonas citronellolis]